VNSQLQLLNGNKSLSPDLVGGNNGAECKLMYTDAGYEEYKGCDFDAATALYGEGFPVGTTNYPSSDPFERSFYVQWPQKVLIASFLVDSPITFNYVDIYITDVFPFTRNDSTLLVFQNLYPNGLYNLASPRLGKYLVFMPLDTQNPYDITVREIRVWPEYDLASTATLQAYYGLTTRIVGPIGNYCITLEPDCNSYASY
jgi:hypothetical protein